MIIKRKYACYYQLTNEPESKAVILKAFKKGGVSEELTDYLLTVNGGVIVCNTDMGSCIPASVYNDFCAELEKLDRIKPFDNGLTYSAVTDILSFSSRKGNAMAQVLCNRAVESPPRIVQVIAFEHDGESIRPIEPWNLGTIMI